MISQYRNLFLKLAETYMQDSTRFKIAEETLDKMNKVISPAAIPMDYRIEYFVAVLYKNLKNDAKYTELMDNVIKQAEEEIKNHANINPNDYYNPYRVLLEAYENKKDYSNALRIIGILKGTSRQADPNLIQREQDIRNKMNQGK